MPSLITCLKYQNAPAAIDFLKAAFGFTAKAVYPDPENPKMIHHAELVLGSSMIMIGSLHTPAERGNTITLYAVIDDADAHCAQAKLHGTHVLREPHDNEGYPGRSYEAEDTEGHTWMFGTYDPWA